MFLIGSSLFKNGREIIFHYIKEINSIFIGSLFLKAEPDFQDLLQKNFLHIYFLQHVKIKKKQIPPSYLCQLGTKLFSGGKNKWGHIAVFTTSPSNIYCKNFERNTVLYVSYI